MTTVDGIVTLIPSLFVIYMMPVCMLQQDQQPESAEVGPEPGHVLESLHTRGLASRWHSEGADGASAN